MCRSGNKGCDLCCFTDEKEYKKMNLNTVCMWGDGSLWGWLGAFQSRINCQILGQRRCLMLAVNFLAHSQRQKWCRKTNSILNTAWGFCTWLSNTALCWMTLHCIVEEVEPGSTLLSGDPYCQSPVHLQSGLHWNEWAFFSCSVIVSLNMALCPQNN